MTIVSGIILALLLASGVPQDAPAPDPAPEQAASQPAAEPERPKGFDLARLKIDQCPGERFDFEVGDGSKVGLCSNAGASNDEIAAMLESAIKQLESTDRMRPEVRDAIVVQMRTKVEEVRAR